MRRKRRRCDFGKRDLYSSADVHYFTFIDISQFTASCELLSNHHSELSDWDDQVVTQRESWVNYK